jgi:outer membrane protein OmpA-like peptidoglycan-associated protein
MGSRSRRERQVRPAAEVSPAPAPKDRALRRAAVNAIPAEATTAVPSSVRETLTTTGEPLDTATRSTMESRFGQDFSGIRVHADPESASSAQAVGAKAYASGDEVAFAPGRYAPKTASGERLLAHELAHVVQTRQGGAEAGAEARATAAASRVAAGETVTATHVGGAGSGIHLAADGKADTAPARLTVNLETLDGFGLNSAALTSGHRERIVGLAATVMSWLNRVPTITIGIAGHTDATGGEADNLGLGQRRAEAVRDALVKEGVPAARLEVVSKGESALKVETQRAEPRNRRVEVQVLGQPLSLTPTTPAQRGGLSGDTPRRTNLIPPTLPLGGGPRSIPIPKPTPNTLPPQGQATEPRPGKLGDVAKAALKLPGVQKALDDFLETQKARLDKLSPGEKAAVGGTAVAITAGTLAGVLSDPSTRKSFLEAANGQEIPIPGIKGVKMQILTDPGGGAIIKFDLATVIPGLR